MRTAEGEGSDVASAGAVDDSGESVQVFDIRDELDAEFFGYVAVQGRKRVLEDGVTAQDDLAPRGVGSLVECVGGLTAPIRAFCPQGRGGLVDERIWFREVVKAGAVENQIRAQGVEQDEEIVAAELDG